MSWRDSLACAAIGFSVVLAVPPVATAQETQTAVPTRDLAAINWMDFRDVVPSRSNTVLIPTGTIEPHGVVNNGADITAPVAIARALAERTNAMIAPVVPYGVTGAMDAYPGSFSISESAYRAYVKDVLSGWAKTGFKNLVVINGHGGPQSAILDAVAREVGQERKVRTLVIHWWTYCSDVTQEVFGEDGGHAGWNETAMIQAIDPALVHKQRYTDQMAIPNPTPGSYSAYPFPATIGLYKPGQGLVRFDQAKADEYFKKVVEKVASLIQDTRKRWDDAGL